MASDLTEEQLRALYSWIDAIPLSRPKRNIARDFSDGVMLAEVVAVYFPAMVELHNYSPANSVQQKVYNFDTLNARVLKKLGFQITRTTIEDIVNCRPGAIENVLNSLQYKMAQYREKSKSGIKNVKRNSGGGSVGKSPRPSSEMSNRGQYAESSSSQNDNNRQHMSQAAAVDEEILMEKEQQIRECKETIEILELKVSKLEQLLKLKDAKIKKLMEK